MTFIFWFLVRKGHYWAAKAGRLRAEKPCEVGTARHGRAIANMDEP